MKKIRISNTGVYTAPIALGCMRMAGLSTGDAEKVIMTALDNGIDYFDHADIYGAGESERLFGEVLKNNPGLREKMIVQGKCGIRKGFYDLSKEHIIHSVEGILTRLGIDNLDFLLLHRPDALMEPDEIAEAFTALEKDGKVKYFGVSNENSSQIAYLQSACSQKLCINQIQFGPAHTGIIDNGINVNVHCDRAADRDGSVLNYCRMNNVTIQAWSPFQYGMFEGVFLKTDKYAQLNAMIAEIAEKYNVTDSAVVVAWIMRHPAHIQTIIGSMNPQRIHDIAKALEFELTREEWYRIYTAAGNELP